MIRTLRYTHFLRFNSNGSKIDSFWVAASSICGAIEIAERQPMLPGEYVDWDYVADTFDQMNDYVRDEKAYAAIYVG